LILLFNAIDFLSLVSRIKKVIFLCLFSNIECDPNQFLIHFLSLPCFKN